LTENLLLGITGIIILGITAQWLAWRLGLPSILLLLFFGFAAGPVTGFLDPDQLLGQLLFPLVSASVAIILFEGGLSLKFNELRETRRAIRNLIFIGGLLTWIMATAAAYFILEFAFPIALLFGAILVVTGPTVIIPLLRDVRITSRVASILKWEGIVNDPIGAMLALLVFEATLVTGFQETALIVAIHLLRTVLLGVLVGSLSAWLLIQMLKRYWVPGYLQNAVTLMFVLGAFTASNSLQAESGLFTVTLMGIVLANQKVTSVKHIIQFKEHLGILLLSSLFIILAARLKLDQVTSLGLNNFIFLVVLILIIRPLSVWLTTLRSNLRWQEKLFLAWMAPRGIVAASVTAVFALELAEEAGYTQAELMVPEMFLIIVGTVTIYGLSAAPLGRWLGVAQPNPQGVLFGGAHAWARAMATMLKNEGYQVLMVDSNQENIKAARLDGLPTVYASILSEYILDEIELGSLGRLLAVTPNDEVNSLATLHFAEVFDQAELYQLPIKEARPNRKETVSQPLRGRFLFRPQATYDYLMNCFENGFTIKKTQLAERFDYSAFQERHGDQNIPLFLIKRNGGLAIFTSDNDVFPQPGDSLISLAKAA
jgi:NhaP-type Na+/H+ or K+/H+ antiporter